MFSNRRVGLYQRTYDTGACLMGIRMSFSYHRFSFFEFYFLFSKCCLICMENVLYLLM